MQSGDIAIATVTWARSDSEGRHLVRALDVLRGIGIPVAVSDRGASPGFLDRLRSMDGLNVTVARQPGLVAQVQDSITRAAAGGREYVLYTEPDKLEFFERGLCEFVGRAPAGEDVGVVLAARSEASMATFPPVQRYTEAVFNYLAAAQIGVPGDYCYGPFLMHRTLLAAIAELPQHLGWGWRPATFVSACRQGKRLVHLEGNYPCPRHDNEDAGERTHRVRQLSQNLLGLLS